MLKDLSYYKKNKAEFASLYKEMYGEAICFSCTGSIDYAYKKVKEDKNFFTRKIRMKCGKVINTINRPDTPSKYRGIWNCRNINDDISLYLISVGYESFFINKK